MENEENKVVEEQQNETPAASAPEARAKKKLPPFAVLAIIATVAAVVLALTNMVTRGPIKELAMKDLREAFDSVMPADSYEEIAIPEEYTLVSALYVAKDPSEAVIGYCVTAGATGFNGKVAVTFGVDPDGKITGCKVGDGDFAETPGYGARAKDAAFQDQFKGLDGVNGGSFDALAGATVTSRAVLKAANEALKCVAVECLKTTPADPALSFN